MYEGEVLILIPVHCSIVLWREWRSFLSADFGGFWKGKDKETQKGDVYSTTPRVKSGPDTPNKIG